MTRRLAVIVALVTAGVVLTAWLLFAVRVTSSASLGVTLRVNLERRLVITPGTPLQVEISLSSAPGDPALSLGGRWCAWHEYVQLDDPVTGKSVPWPLSVVSATSVALGPKPDSPLVSSTGRLAHLEGGRRVHTVTLVATPAATARALPGLYRLRAVVRVPQWHPGGWHGRAVSSPVTITVRSPDDGKEGVEVLERQRLKYAAKYHLSVGELAEARRLAEELRADRANDPATLILLGDISAAESQPDRALAEYRRALALLPPSYEQPTLLLDRIARATDRPR